ncbi:MAG: ABC transporter ATP-binding protein [Candidatus Rokuibacteriota bacterium]|nr:MAG: ABC transporter ATP-binding protein [Candidatus Rokubacteria bacterium]
MSRPDPVAHESEAVVDVTDVTCRFGRVCALDGVSLRVLPGTVVGVVGPNGAGKTTLIDAICGLVRPSQGMVRVLGEDVVAHAAALRARIGVLPQETALYDEVTAVQNLRFAAALYGVPRADARIAEVLELVGLSARARDVVRGFSGGMQRRLAIARALLHDPPLLVLDEPTVGVDVEARHQIWAHIRSLRAGGRTVVLTTNYLDEAEALCDRVAILRSGKLVAEDTPAALGARTGRCLELTCWEESAAKLGEALRNHPGVLRTEVVDFGVRVYLGAGATPEDVVREARKVCPIDGFRTRSPDLVEVFRSLTADDRPS